MEVGLVQYRPLTIYGTSIILEMRIQYTKDTEKIGIVTQSINLFDTYQGDDDEVFDYEPVDRNIDLIYMPTDVVSVDIAHSPQGWRVYQYPPLIKPDKPNQQHQ